MSYYPILPFKRKTLIKIGITITVIILLNLVFNSQITNPLSPTPTPSISRPTPVPNLITTQTPESIEKGIQQTQADYNSGQVVLNTLKKYPFLKNLPIDTNKYTLVFDFQKNSIRVKLHNSNQKQVENEIQQRLKQIGVPPSIPVYYLN